MAFRILSLDGGGIRGVLTAQMLIRFEEKIKVPLSEYFDLVAGTSTGSVLAAANSIGMPSEKIVNMYRTQGKRVFPYTSSWDSKRWPTILKYGPFGPKFSDAGLLEIAQNVFGDKKLADVKDIKLLIPSYDTRTLKPIIFKSWRDDFASVPLWEACVCSASAPTFFPPHRLEINGKVYSAIDGGLAANNPTVCALAEALRLGYQLSELQIISVGTGDPTRTVEWEVAQGWGTLQWISNGRLLSLLTESPSDATDYIAKQIIGDDSRYVRLQFPLDRQLTAKRLSDDLDDASEENVNNLIEAANAYMKLPEVEQKIDRFVAGKETQPAE